MTLDDVISKVTDPYERQARLYPALLALLSLLALVMLLFGPKATALTGGLSYSILCGGLYLTTNLCRELGKRLEGESLSGMGWETYDFSLLRHRDKTIEAVTKRRYHSFWRPKSTSPFQTRIKKQKTLRLLTKFISPRFDGC